MFCINCCKNLSCPKRAQKTLLRRPPEERFKIENVCDSGSAFPGKKRARCNFWVAPTRLWRDAGSIRSLAHCRLGQRLHGPRAKGMSLRPSLSLSYSAGASGERLSTFPASECRRRPPANPPAHYHHAAAIFISK